MAHTRHQQELKALLTLPKLALESMSLHQGQLISSSGTLQLSLVRSVITVIKQLSVKLYIYYSFLSRRLLPLMESKHLIRHFITPELHCTEGRRGA